MKYKLRPGVVRTKICGVYLLLPSREASEFCPPLRINIFTTTLIECIEKTGSYDKVCEVIRILSHASPEDAHARADKIAEDLCDRGYLIRVEEEP